ncbi:hypothetical protein [Bacillus atrophaeus]|uniref:hypothetical protein n=1 Tax=Bacillus atrophaeus TaxID=1452 RepID=UPI00227DF06B|nr:hypothetical protein [Bacillus atrophaeus]MCY8826925.1 hypothetical protein [Bacillus atrophaeus]MCY8842717.1 hypothetical protein [Bacillus atrophaeus]MEC0805966.1 hypothetical protein [Bacillus atrophaeus]MEC0854046.1 hypothetical protein [Bacillus atrophaeus]MEC0856987.1 hypothetical protein [Bacillus atrophaeus]
MQIGNISLEQDCYLILNISSSKESRFKFLLKNQIDNKIHLINDEYESNNNCIRINIDTIKTLVFGTYELGLWLSEYNHKPVNFEGELQVSNLLSKNDLLSVEISLSENKTILLTIKPNILFYFKQYDLNDSVCKGLIESDNRDLFKNVKSSIIFKYRTKSNSYNKYSNEFDKSIDLNECVSFNINELFNDVPGTEIIDLFIRLETQSHIHDYPLNFFPKNDLILINKYYCSNNMFEKFKPFATIYNTLAFIKRKVDIEVLLSEVNELDDSLRLSGALISEDIIINKIKSIILVFKSGYGIERTLNASFNKGIFNFDIDSYSINILEPIQKWELYIRIYNSFEEKIDVPIILFNLNKKHLKREYKINNYSISINESKDNKTSMILSEK